jgi:hypothetical protein
VGVGGLVRGWHFLPERDALRLPGLEVELHGFLGARNRLAKTDFVGNNYTPKTVAIKQGAATAFI